MDSRVEAHADVLVDHCTDVQSGDMVLVKAPPVAEDLVVALYEKIGERGGDPVWIGSNPRAARAYMQAADPDTFELSEHLLALVEAADVFIGIKGTTNTKETADVDPEKSAARATVQKPLLDAKMETRWVGTQYPAAGNAQEAEMSTDAYEAFVWNAVLTDWEAQRAHQSRLVDVLETADEVHIRSGDVTDIRLSIDDMGVVNDAGEKNLPGGEVFTAPIPDSVDGEVLFDKPVLVQGRELVDVSLRFEDGEVVEHGAAKNEAVLTSLLDTDEGARRVGELGIGMNRDITRFTANMLFDEKMGDTVHLALGRAYEETVPDDRERNDSAVHQDLIVDVSEDSTITVDGAVVYEDGYFAFEDGFDAR